jgi:hypothetical protein
MPPTFAEIMYGPELTALASSRRLHLRSFVVFSPSNSSSGQSRKHIKANHISITTYYIVIFVALPNLV